MAQFPSVIGETAVNTLVQYLNGEIKAEDIPSFTDAGTKVYTAEDLEGAYATAF